MDKNLFRFILCDTLYSGNIGSAARALKNFGFSKLVLVNPRQGSFPELLKMAGRAIDLVENAEITGSLGEALKDVEHAVGFSRRARGIGKPVISAEEFSKLLEGRWKGSKVGLLFGSEKFGLTNSQIENCEKIIRIPTSPDYPSLNLASSIAIICYEIVRQTKPQTVREAGRKVVSFKERNQLYQRLQSLLEETGFFKMRDSTCAMVPIRDIFERSGLDKADYDTMMGIAKALEKAARKND